MVRSATLSVSGFQTNRLLPVIPWEKVISLTVMSGWAKIGLNGRTLSTYRPMSQATSVEAWVKIWTWKCNLFSYLPCELSVKTWVWTINRYRSGISKRSLRWTLNGFRWRYNWTTVNCGLQCYFLCSHEEPVRAKQWAIRDGQFINLVIRHFWQTLNYDWPLNAVQTDWTTALANLGRG